MLRRGDRTGARSRRPAASLEWLALGVGVTAALTLGWAALQLDGVDRSVGRGLVADRAAVQAELVEARWERLVLDPEAWFAPGEGVEFVWGADLESWSVLAPDRAAAPTRDATLIATLLRRADEESDAERAASALEAARELAVGTALTSAVELRALRRARRAGDTDALERTFERAMGAARPGRLLEGLPEPAALLIAAAGGLSADRAALEAGRILDLALDGGLAFERPLTVDVPAATGLATLQIAPRVDVLLDRLASLGDADAQTAADGLRDRILERARLDAIEALGPSTEGLSVLSTGSTTVAVERGPDGGRARTLGPEPTLALLAASLSDSELVDPELGLARASAVGAAERLGPPIELAGLPFAVALRHPDMDRWVADSAGRVRAVRVGLGGLALLALTAAGVITLTLRRQRRLAEARVRWIASVSHELRTPVAALLLNAERLERTRASRPERLVRYHDAILAESRRLERMVAQVMDLSRIERGRPPAVEPVAQDPAQLFEERARALEPQLAAAGVTLVFEAHDLPSGAQLDGTAIGRVLENLLRNAAEHARADRVLVAWGTLGRARGLWLEVRDDGIGIERERTLFRPFERGRAADPSRGLGLGLGIAAELVAAHGGRLDFADPRADWPGAGFRIELPLLSSSTDAAEEPSDVTREQDR